MLKVKTKRDIVVWISGGRCPVERLPGAPDFITTDTYHAFNDAADCVSYQLFILTIHFYH